MVIRPFRDDANAWNCIYKAAEDVQTYIILIYKGPLDQRIKLTDEVRRMRKELQAAIVEGSRAKFDEVFALWSRHEMATYFAKHLNKHLATLPAPKRRGQPYERDFRW